ncbi:MAG TPA: hypothetical protein VHU22_24450 [Xanthobacteraceae bacterium]|jgi:hypothetical protein|nr:hypothetical protein [Xanthobacteraceae bacterium]
MEFERLGEFLVYENVKQGAIYNDEAKRQAAFRWLSEQAVERRKRETETFERDTETFEYVRKTYFAAIAAVIVGIAGILVAIALAFLHPF